jgi:hypothetical protein
MAGFLEEHVRPRQTDMRSVFQRTYVETFAEWAADPVHTTGAFDTERCSRFKEIAESRLHAIAQRYDRRFLLKALRTLPVHIVGRVTISVGFDEILPLLRDATLAAWLYARPTRDETLSSGDGTHAVQVTGYALEFAEKNLALDLARLLGAASARSAAETAYRYAGKGARLKVPELVPLEALKVFDNYPADGIVLVDSPQFEHDPPLLESVQDYDRRRSRENRVGGSGMPILREPRSKPQHFWWTLALIGDPLTPVAVEVHYPERRLTVVTTCLSVSPCDVTSEMNLLRQFSGNFERRIGFDLETFSALCHGLFYAVFNETGFAQLSVRQRTKSRILMESRDGPAVAAAAGAPGFLFEALCGGTLRGPRKGYVDYMTSALDRAGLRADRTVADGFIERFSRHESIDHPLSPALFFPVDRDIVVLDFALMNEFHELCLRLVTSGDGEIGNRRADLFEDYARSVLINSLGLLEREIPLQPNMGVKEGETDYGDIDFAFIRSGVLVHLDMKSWQRRPEYFRGDYMAILNRQKTLEELYRKVQRRGEKLVQVLAERGIRVSTRLDLLCVAEVEYVAPGALWYGTLPKVLTPREIVSLVRDRERLRRAVAAAADASTVKREGY